MFKSDKSRTALPRSAVLNENIETLMSSNTALMSSNTEGSKRQETMKEEASSLRLVKKTQTQSKPDRKLLVRIPSVQQVDHSDEAQDRDNCDDSELNQAESRCDSVRGTNEPPSVRGDSSRLSHAESSSDSLGGADEYPDDFTSPDPVDGYSPDPLSDPKPGLVQAGRSQRSDDPSSSDSYSETSQRNVVLPMPIKATSSPHRSLRGTHIIRPRTLASALSLSSETSHGDRPASSLSLRSTTPKTVKRSTNRRSVSGSLRASESQLSDSIEESFPVRGYSVDTNISTDSKSSPEPHEEEETRDELGSLGFRNRYQHISELVANKLPGYTL
ncbi:microtubule-associated protein 10-like [Osmerus mordax]|uniref:microtubule-associated protein 10-like n=1 Tax=Osmerus mordax TaxID=8014 RepID=UPI003510281C